MILFIKVFVATWMAGVAAISLVLLTLPAVSPPSPDHALIIFVITLALMFLMRLWNGVSFYTYLVFLLILAISPFSFVARGFGRVDMLAFLFHYQFGTEGATLAGFEDAISTTVISSILLIITQIGLSQLLQRTKSVVIIFSSLLIIFNPGMQYGFSRLIEGQYSSGLEEKIIEPVIQTRFENNEDLLIVYLEGFERRYLQHPMFANSQDVLASIFDKASAMFTGINQVEGTGWSVAGVVASQCGVPPLPNGLTFGDGFAEADGFLDTRHCLSDILKNLGYSTSFIVGSELKFGGLGKFLESHSFDTIIGIDAFRERLAPSNFEYSVVENQVDDQAVYDLALDHQNLLLAQDNPFFMVVETFTLHGKTALISRRCTENNVASTTTNQVDAVACVAKDLNDFLSRFNSQQGERALRIILMSDHLNHYHGKEWGLPQVDRRNTVAFFDNAEDYAIVRRQGTMLDIYPTILDWLGLLSIDKGAGLGRSLFGLQPTLLELHGLDFLNEAFAKDAGLAASIWH